jgi:hypothetical protein
MTTNGPLSFPDQKTSTLHDRQTTPAQHSTHHPEHPAHDNHLTNMKQKITALSVTGAFKRHGILFTVIMER